MRATAALVVACALAACGGGKSAARDGADTVSRTGAPARLDVVVLLARGPMEGLLVPLACYDAKVATLWTGDGCLSRIPTGAAIGVLEVPVQARASAEHVALATCNRPEGMSSIQALSVAGDIDRGAVALWPAGAPVAQRASADPEWETSTAEDEALVNAVAALDPSVQGEMIIQQALRSDLDGDGRPERLYVVAVDDDSADIPRRFSGVLIDWGQGPKVVLSRAATPGEEHAVRALADLDHDGRRELVIDERWNDGYDLGLWRLTEARALERMAGIDCDR